MKTNRHNTISNDSLSSFKSSSFFSPFCSLFFYQKKIESNDLWRRIKLAFHDTFHSLRKKVLIVDTVHIKWTKYHNKYIQKNIENGDDDVETWRFLNETNILIEYILKTKKLRGGKRERERESDEWYFGTEQEDNGTNDDDYCWKRTQVHDTLQSNKEKTSCLKNSLIWKKWHKIDHHLWKRNPTIQPKRYTDPNIT